MLTRMFKWLIDLSFFFLFPAYISVFGAFGILQSVIIAQEKKEGNSFNAMLVLE